MRRAILLGVDESFAEYLAGLPPESSSTPAAVVMTRHGELEIVNFSAEQYCHRIDVSTFNDPGRFIAGTTHTDVAMTLVNRTVGDSAFWWRNDFLDEDGKLQLDQVIDGFHVRATILVSDMRAEFGEAMPLVHLRGSVSGKFDVTPVTEAAKAFIVGRRAVDLNLR